MSKERIWRGGLPYAPDRRRLEESFPVAELTEGRVIQHELIEAIIQCQRATPRYYGIVNSWISRERNEHGIVMCWEPSVGLKILPPAEVLSHAETRFRSKLRQTGRAIRMYGWVDRGRLNEAGQARLDHQMHIADALRGAADQARKQMAVELAPVESLPKRLLKKIG